MQRAFKPISTFPSSSEEGRGRGTSAAKKAKSDTASVDQFNKFLYKFTTNSVSGQIERAKELLKGNNYGWKLLKTQIPILESLTAGLQESEISKLLLPNYKCLKWLYSVNSRDLKSGQWALQVVNSYQLLLISYLTFAERATKVIEVLCQHCIYKFIKDDIMGFRSANARTLKLASSRTHRPKVYHCCRHFAVIVVRWSSKDCSNDPQYDRVEPRTYCISRNIPVFAQCYGKSDCLFDKAKVWQCNAGRKAKGFC